MTTINGFDAILDLLADKIAERLADRPAQSQQSAKLMDVKAAAAYMSRSPGMVRHMIQNGELPPSVVKRIGRRLFLVTSELDRWIEAQ